MTKSPDPSNTPGTPPVETGQGRQPQPGKTWPIWLSFLPALVTLPWFVLELIPLSRQAGFSFLPVYVLLVALLIWRRYARTQQSAGELNWLSSGVFLAGLLFLAGGIAISNPLLTASALPLALLGQVFFSKAPGSARRSLSSAILLLALPTLIPVLISLPATARLQTLMIKISSYFLDLQGILHSLEPAGLILTNSELTLAQLTSGFQALGISLCLTGFLIVLHRTNWLQSLILLGLTPVWAILLDTSRIVLNVALLEKYGQQVATGTSHVLLEGGLLCLLLLLVYSSYHVVRFAFNPIDRISATPIKHGLYMNPYSVLWNKILVFSATSPKNP